MTEQSLTIEQERNIIAELQEQLRVSLECNALLETMVRKQTKNSMKVSDKGAISVYGLGRFPVTLYASQWQNLFDRQDAIKQFIIDNMDKLATKEKQ